MGYERYLTEHVERVLTLICQPINSVSSKMESNNRVRQKLSKHDAEEIKNVLEGEDGSSLLLSETSKAKIFCSLSYYIPPVSIYPEENLSEIQQLFGENIYEMTNLEPPNSYSHAITINYLKHMLKAKKEDDFKRVIEEYIEILCYWVGEDHLFLCSVYELLSDYYGHKHHPEDSINFLKQSLTTCIRAGGTHTRQVGSKYYLLG